MVGTPTADREHVYFNARDNVLRALDRRNGARRWRSLLAGRPTDGPLRVDPLIVVAGVSPTIEFFDADSGLPRGQYLAPGELAAMPRIIPDAQPPNPILILVTRTGEVIGLTAAAGPPRLSLSLPPEPLLPRPIAVSLADFVDWFPVEEPADPWTPPAILPLSGIVDWFPLHPPSPLPGAAPIG